MSYTHHISYITFNKVFNITVILGAEFVGEKKSARSPSVLPSKLLSTTMLFFTHSRNLIGGIFQCTKANFDRKSFVSSYHNLYSNGNFR